MKTFRSGHSWAVTAAALLLVVGVAGCKSKNPAPIDTSFDDASSSTSRDDDMGGAELPDVDLESLVFNRDSGLRPVYFDYDSFALRPDALATLRQNAELLKQYPNVMVQIEGHCDERGTQEYNLALGERRALAVREFLMKLGISGNRLITISYGEEFPAVIGSNEAAWAQNRRCEFSRAQ